MKENSEAANLIEPTANPNAPVLSRHIVLMGESELGQRVDGSKFFETGHGTFPSIKAAEVFANENIKATRWLVGERVIREGQRPTHEFVSKPRTPRHRD